MNHPTECDRLLEAFRKNGFKLTPLDITNGLKINQYNRAISDLRKKGYKIENKYLGTYNGKKHTVFILSLEKVLAELRPEKTALEVAREIKEARDPQYSLQI